MHRRYSININTKIIQLDFWAFQINCLIIQAEGKEERDFIKNKLHSKKEILSNSFYS
jgi:hypothetical protein